MSERDSRERAEAETDQTAGRLKEDVGKLTGDEKLANEGRVERAEGEMKEGLTEATETVREAAEDARETLKD